MATYWEGWEVVDYNVYGVDITNGARILIPGGLAHDVFQGPAQGIGATRMIGTVYWIASSSSASSVADRMPAGGVPMAGALRSTHIDPFIGVVPVQLLVRDEYFHYEVF
jgi:hypothetical protein